MRRALNWRLTPESDVSAPEASEVLPDTSWLEAEGEETATGTATARERGPSKTYQVPALIHDTLRSSHL